MWKGGASPTKLVVNRRSPCMSGHVSTSLLYHAFTTLACASVPQNPSSTHLLNETNKRSWARTWPIYYNISSNPMPKRAPPDRSMNTLIFIIKNKKKKCMYKTIAFSSAIHAWSVDIFSASWCSSSSTDNDRERPNWLWFMKKSYRTTTLIPTFLAHHVA